MTEPVAPTRFPIRFTGANKAMAVLGLNPGNSHVDIGTDEVEVRMGWAFSVRFPRASASRVAEDQARVLGWGVHGWRGTWLVNGSSSGLVRIDLAEPVKGRVLGIPVTVRTLRVAMEDPGALVAALT